MLITVYGIPAPQGSKSFKGMAGGHAILAESSKKVKPWRLAVEYAVLESHPFGGRADPILIRGPVAVDIVFCLPRPKSAKRGAVPDKKPDIDKLQRSTFDALKTAGVYEDDSRIVQVSCIKLYAGDTNALAVPGAIIFVESAEEYESNLIKVAALCVAAVQV